jgi:hypothetical protein
MFAVNGRNDPRPNDSVVDARVEPRPGGMSAKMSAASTCSCLRQRSLSPRLYVSAAAWAIKVGIKGGEKHGVHLGKSYRRTGQQ